MDLHRDHPSEARAVPVRRADALFRHHNRLPADVTQKGGFGRHEITTHEHNGHYGAENDGFTGAFFCPGQFYDYHWPIVHAGTHTIGPGRPHRAGPARRHREPGPRLAHALHPGAGSDAGRGDPIGKALFETYKHVTRPNLRLAPQDVAVLVDYLAARDAGHTGRVAERRMAAVGRK